MRALIVDDEPLACKRLIRLLQSEPDVEIAGTCTDGRQAIEQIARQQPDLVLLDIQMPDLDGFGVIDAVSVARMPLTIFVTAYDDHALRAFEVHALDYLLKPFDGERLRAAVRRARHLLSGAGALAQRPGITSLLDQPQLDVNAEQHKQGPLCSEVREPPLARLLIKAGPRLYFLRTSEIDWIQAEGNYLCLHAGSGSHLVRGTLGELEARLDKERFLRVHRSTLVNVDSVKELCEDVVVLRNGTKLKLSRGCREKLLKETEHY